MIVVLFLLLYWSRARIKQLFQLCTNLKFSNRLMCNTSDSLTDVTTHLGILSHATPYIWNIT